MLVARHATSNELYVHNGAILTAKAMQVVAVVVFGVGAARVSQRLSSMSIVQYLLHG